MGLEGVAETGGEERERVLGLWGRGLGQRWWRGGVGVGEAGDEHDRAELGQELDGIRVHRDRNDLAVGIDRNDDRNDDDDHNDEDKTVAVGDEDEDKRLLSDLVLCRGHCPFSDECHLLL